MNYKNITIIHFNCLERYLLYKLIISSVEFPGLPPFTTNLSILITGNTPTVVLVRKASLHFFISSIVKNSLLRKNHSFWQH